MNATLSDLSILVNPIVVPPPRPEWPDMCHAEPRLRELLERIERRRPFEPGCDFWQVWSLYKEELQTLVGWHGEHPGLRTSDHYDVAYGRLLDAYELKGEG